MRTISTCMMKKLNRKKKALVDWLANPMVFMWGTFAFFFIKGLIWLALLFFGYYFIIVDTLRLIIINNNQLYIELSPEITNFSKKIVLSKNTAGDATSFKNAISINVDVLMNDKFKNNFVILENFNYNNISNKFNLKKYEEEIKKNLAETASDKLIFKLSNIQ